MPDNRSVRRALLLIAIALLGATVAGGCTGQAAAPSGATSATLATSVTTPSAAASLAPAGPATPAPLISPSLRIPAPSLANNLIGDPAELEAVVLLPSDYNASTTRYPTIYFLTGFGDPATSVLGWFGESMTKPAGTAVRPMIVVGVSGANSLYGSFYRNSPVTGNWEDAIAKDLVAYVDSTYRTIPKAESRGIGGHSMGGSGAWELAIRHPDVFGAVGVVAPGLIDEKGAASTQMFANEETIRDEIATLAKLDALSPADAKAQFSTIVRTASDDAEFALAYGATFAPDPSAKTFMRFPYREVDGKLVVDPEVMKAWDAGYGDQDGKLAQYGANIARLRGIQIEYGNADAYEWIRAGCPYLGKALTKAGIANTVIEFEGDHGQQVKERVETSLLPFFSSKLAG